MMPDDHYKYRQYGIIACEGSLIFAFLPISWVSWKDTVPTCRWQTHPHFIRAEEEFRWVLGQWSQVLESRIGNAPVVPQNSWAPQGDSRTFLPTIGGNNETRCSPIAWGGCCNNNLHKESDYY
jgi:hypothetical protein